MADSTHVRMTALAVKITMRIDRLHKRLLGVHGILDAVATVKLTTRNPIQKRLYTVPQQHATVSTIQC